MMHILSYLAFPLCALLCSFSSFAAAASESHIRIPVELRKEQCNTALFKTLIRTIYQVSPFRFFSNEKIKEELWSIRTSICQVVEETKATDGNHVNIEFLRERCFKMCKSFGIFYSDFEWQCEKLWGVLFDPLHGQPRGPQLRFLGLNRDVFSMTDFAVGSAFKTVLMLAMKTRNLPIAKKEARLRTAAEHEAVMANILMVYRPCGELQMHRAAHDYFTGHIYNPRIESSLLDLPEEFKVQKVSELQKVVELEEVTTVQPKENVPEEKDYELDEVAMALPKEHEHERVAVASNEAPVESELYGGDLFGDVLIFPTEDSVPKQDEAQDWSGEVETPKEDEALPAEVATLDLPKEAETPDLPKKVETPDLPEKVKALEIPEVKTPEKVELLESSEEAELLELSKEAFDEEDVQPKKPLVPEHPKIESRVAIWSEPPTEFRDPNNLPMDRFAQIASQVKLVIIFACAVWAVMTFLK